MLYISRLASVRFTFHWHLHGSNLYHQKYDSVSTNQIVDILHLRIISIIIDILEKDNSLQTKWAIIEFSQKKHD